MKKILVLAAVAAMVLGSCTSEEVINPTATLDNKADAISFGTFIDRVPNALRAADIDLTALQASTSGFKVLAYNTGSTVWASTAGTATPNFMDDQLVKWNSPAWEYTPLKYWPKVGSAYGKVTFFGYAPVTGATVAGQAGDNPKIDFVTAATASTQVDLIVDALADKTGPATNLVKFEFDHILSKIAFSAITAADYSPTTVTITSLEVFYKEDELKKDGIYTFNTSGNLVATNWDLGITPFASGADVTAGELVNSATSSLSHSSATVFGDNLKLIPQTCAAGDLYAVLGYTINSDNATATVDLPAITWAAGNAYTYNFVISLDAVVFDPAITVKSWTENTATDVTVQ